MRTKERSKLHGEVFTPPELVDEMLDALDFDWTDPSKKILEPSVGNGNFIEGLVKRLMAGLATAIPDPAARYKHIFESMIHAVDILPDNIAECIERFKLDGIRHHFVVADALTYSYKFDEWEPKEELFIWP